MIAAQLAERLESVGCQYPADDHVVIDEPVRIGVDQPSTATFLGFLRDCCEHRIRVSWHGELASGVDPTPLHHLPPPASLTGPAGAQAMTAWRRGHRYGGCYFRQGPGFLLIKDAREADCVVSLTLDEPSFVATFLRCGVPIPRESLDPAGRDAAALLEEERLLWSDGELLVALPFRMRHWPVPCTAV